MRCIQTLSVLNLLNDVPVNLRNTVPTKYRLFTGNGSAVVRFRLTSIEGVVSEWFTIVNSFASGNLTSSGWFDVIVDIGDTLSIVQSTQPSSGYPFYRVSL